MYYHLHLSLLNLPDCNYLFSQAKKYHPDRNQGSEEKQKEASRKFQEIVAAYEEIVKIKEEEQKEANQWMIVKIFKNIKKGFAKAKEKRNQEKASSPTFKQWMDKM